MLKIGWASADITPDRPVMLAGQFRVRVSEKVNDPITVTALAIEGEHPADQAIMISCDLVSVTPPSLERLRQLVHAKLPDFDVRKLFTNATHTHTSLVMVEGVYPEQSPPVMQTHECLELFARGAAQAAVDAWKSRKPAGVSWAFGNAVVGHNRRAVYFDGSAAMYGKTNRPDFECIEGYEDHSLDVLFTWDAKENLTGIVVNIACPSQVTENGPWVSADYWHETRTELWKRFGKGVFILPQCAAGGDQSPHFLLYEREEEYMRKRRNHSERQEIANRIAHGVEHVFEAARDDIRTELPFKHVVEELHVPVRRITDEEFEQSKKDYAQNLADQAAGKDPGPWKPYYAMLRRAKSIQARYEAAKSNSDYTIELHVLRLGDVALATNPFELFLDYGLRMKARSKALQTFVIQLAAGSGSYLPTRRAIAAKSYGAGAADNVVGPEGGQMLVERTLHLIDRLWT